MKKKPRCSVVAVEDEFISLVLQLRALEAVSGFVLATVTQPGLGQRSGSQSSVLPLAPLFEHEVIRAST